MFDEFKRQVEKKLYKVKPMKVSWDAPLEEPPGDFGDIATACFVLGPVLKKSPKNIAEDLTSEIKPSGLIKEVKAAGGYINFYLDYEKLAPELINKIKLEGDNWGRGKEQSKIVLEHTSANPDGPLHIGHARNAIIGDTLARIMRFAGYEVETQYYINDMGRQLAVVVWGLETRALDKIKKDHAISKVYIDANLAVEENPEYGEAISELMKGYEAGNEHVKEKFEYAANYSMDGVKETLKRVDITHDTFVWESTFVRDSSVRKVVEALEGTEYFGEDEVAHLDLQSFGIEKELVLKRSDGTYLYATRDIAYHLWKSKRGQVVDVLGADHKLVSSQVAAALEILGQNAPELIIYEFISLPEGSMSTRRGVFISLDELLDESVKRAYGEVDKRRSGEDEEFKSKIAESIGAGAVRFNIVRIAPEKSMVFRWEDALDFEKQGSPFIQYAYARACRILEKEQAAQDFAVGELKENETAVLRLLSKFPGVVTEAARSRKPALLSAYASELAAAFHRFYMFEPVLKSEEKDFRLNLVYVTGITLRNALNLLGIDAPEKM
ncbi:MAG: arginine--tRNA ligase [Candidatus Hydrothermarchaeaceae archaeon]